MNTLWLASAAGQGEAAAEHGGGALFSILGLEVTSAVTTMWAIMVIILLLFWLATRRMERVPRSRRQVIVEFVVESLQNFLEGLLGPKKARQLLPFLGTFFLFILVSNYSGLLPGAGEIRGFKPPTSNWGVTAGLAVIIFFSVQYLGIRKKGIGYFKHFVEPWYLSPLMLPLGILEELVKPFSLSLRLFANIFGGETVLLALLLAIPYVLPISVLFLELIFGFVQAFIFTLLSAVYIANATAEEHH